jgi:type II secretory pathway pseudopilin PulG
MYLNSRQAVIRQFRLWKQRQAGWRIETLPSSESCLGFLFNRPTPLTTRRRFPLTVSSALSNLVYLAVSPTNPHPIYTPKQNYMKISL